MFVGCQWLEIFNVAELNQFETHAYSVLKKWSLRESRGGSLRVSVSESRQGLTLSIDAMSDVEDFSQSSDRCFVPAIAH